MGAGGRLRPGVQVQPSREGVLRVWEFSPACIHFSQGSRKQDGQFRQSTGRLGICGIQGVK